MDKEEEQEVIQEVIQEVTQEVTPEILPKKSKTKVGKKKASFKEAILISDSINKLSKHLSKIDVRLKKMKKHYKAKAVPVQQSVQEKLTLQAVPKLPEKPQGFLRF